MAASTINIVGPPEGPPERLGPVKENPGFEKFEEVSLDNESDGKNHKKNEKTYNLDDKAVNLVWKSYVCLQAFCSANLKRNRGETTRSQAKKKIIEEYPNIDLGDLDLMLQISPRIYRLLQVFNGNWVLLDVFEEITSIFFKSKMKVGANFEIWLNLVRTGQMADYKKGLTMCGEGKKFMKEAKLDIVKAYFNGVDENLKDFIADDDEM
ncbi:hypothetical protein GLOIN_2v1472148 [Rhizophagus irregularis DAOM 181602=DAOM 197198]|uniref:Uncharacterized protein n=1 Tax=Rhizophagus irregularis (strain DAOM 181602 / DAOM 197198 / MUCL 43194) TaxID=747089 RepID=A0A2P4QPR9_RHIID|nr:hypothetical protein GLOIN_2v1472148 [Rhizophagus irregularis DAOM 181602=DAOM 197198]POG79626.1 hypothetical protein GLOIN_2v1472148 [Rhizophagus irregularis DAOM 181602=DAOM 197198]|eukprot:XP_025186492.1 hypothetical protein GLOIN_2v1472148 [Rhizophagus irregularis DAOM 181602=DAOM 197198]